MTSEPTMRDGAQPPLNANAPPAIAVEHITKKYGEFTAVDDVSFSVADGEIFGLLGPNGAGKSTLIRMMTTLIPITGGKAFIAGHDVSREPDAARRTIGVIPQAMTSDLDLTVEENLSIYAKLYGVPREERKRAITRMLEDVELTKWRGAQTKTLSGVQYAKLAFHEGLHNAHPLFTEDDLKGHGGDLESERNEHEDKTEERRVLFRCRISQRAGDPLQVRLPGRAKNPGDSIYEKAGRERAEHEIFHPGFERDRIFPGKTNQNVKRNRDQLEGDEDENEIDGGDEIH